MPKKEDNLVFDTKKYKRINIIFTTAKILAAKSTIHLFHETSSDSPVYSELITQTSMETLKMALRCVIFRSFICSQIGNNLNC